MATRTKKGFVVGCPFCGADPDDANISVALSDLDALRCDSCNQEFSAMAAKDKAVEVANRWEAVVGWIEQAPLK